MTRDKIKKEIFKKAFGSEPEENTDKLIFDYIWKEAQKESIEETLSDVDNCVNISTESMRAYLKSKLEDL